MVAKTVTALYLTAMPDLQFVNKRLYESKELPSSSPNSAVTVEFTTSAALKL